MVLRIAAACSGGAAPSASPAASGITEVGEGEGSLKVLAWPGYVEDGSTDPAVDWVSSFEQETGCQTTIQTFGTSDEAFTLFQTNPTEYDVISASGDASLRLVAGGFVQPVNVDLIPSYAEIFEDLKNKDYNTVDGVHYGVPHGRGANLLVNLTYDGCCIETGIDLEPGQAITLSVPSFGAIEAEVRWSKDGSAGLRFQPAVAQPAEHQPRSSERISVDAEVLQRRQGQPNYRVRLYDVSRSGCQAEFVERPRVGDHVWIKFEGLESLNAEVCWADGFRAGLRYVSPIHPAVFDLLVQRFSAPS